ncbi:hypothetical protein ACHAWU_003921 [Discostella pseudostelligera]|uniref:Dynein attachment factor N-terminal domain-containing protein n=1 Tax=Discostella pseudostelligera TaxID=259834 RepID=A0ABD3MJL5_9STRA
MSSKSKSTISGNGRTLDMSHLEREIQADVATYRQYKAEDGMKKRAIHTSKDYNEFRNFVSVSQLKPTSGRDVSSLFNGASGSIPTSVRSRNIPNDGQASIGGFDGIIKNRNEVSMSNTLKSNLKLETNPRSAYCGAGAGVSNTVKSSRSVHDFIREWRIHCTTAKSTLSFITRMESEVDNIHVFIVDPKVVCKEYFSAEIDSDVMGDIVEALHLLVTMSVSEKAELLMETSVSTFIHNWLKPLQSCGRFELSLSFLTQDQQAKMKEVCAFLTSSDRGDDEINLLVHKYHETLDKK